jgi:hypothetical protein
MQKVVSIATLTVFSFLLCGYIVTYELMLEQNRGKMQTILKKEPTRGITTIILTINEVKSLVDENEISWQNKRYDILKSEYHGDHITLYVINDDREEMLISALDELENISHKCPFQSKRAINLLDDFFKEYTATPFINLHSSFSSSVDQSPGLKPTLLKGYSQLMGKPPKYLS